MSKRKASSQLTPNTIQSFSESTPYEKASPSVMKSRAIIHVPTQDDFFSDSSSDLVLDDMYETTKSHKTKTEDNNDQVMGDTNNNHVEEKTNTALGGSGSFSMPAFKGFGTPFSGSQKATGSMNFSFGSTNSEKPTPNTFQGVKKTSMTVQNSFGSIAGAQAPNSNSFGKKEIDMGENFEKVEEVEKEEKEETEETEEKEEKEEKPSTVTEVSVERLENEKLSEANEEKQNDTTDQKLQRSENTAENTDEKKTAPVAPAKGTFSFGVPSFGSTTFGSGSGSTFESVSSGKSSFGGSNSFGTFKGFGGTSGFGASTSKIEEASSPSTGLKGFGGTSGFGASTKTEEASSPSTGFKGFGGFGASTTKTEESPGNISSKPKPSFSSFSSTSSPNPQAKTSGGFGFNSPPEKQTSFGTLAQGDSSNFLSNSRTGDATKSPEASTIGSESSSPVLEKPDSVPTGEEGEENQFEAVSKLYRFVEGKWEVFSQGKIKINKFKDENKFRILMRTEGGLKLMLNSGVFKGMNPSKKEGEKVYFIANNLCLAEDDLSTFIARFKTSEDSDQFFTVLSDSIKSLN